MDDDEEEDKMIDLENERGAFYIKAQKELQSHIVDEYTQLAVSNKKVSSLKFNYNNYMYKYIINFV